MRLQVRRKTWPREHVGERSLGLPVDGSARDGMGFDSDRLARQSSTCSLQGRPGISSWVRQGRGAGIRPARTPQDSSRVLALKAEQLFELDCRLFARAGCDAMRKLPPGLSRFAWPQGPSLRWQPLRPRGRIVALHQQASCPGPGLFNSSMVAASRARDNFCWLKVLGAGDGMRSPGKTSC